jgi:hypothetical protein
VAPVGDTVDLGGDERVLGQDKKFLDNWSVIVLVRLSLLSIGIRVL